MSCLTYWQRRTLIKKEDFSPSSKTKYPFNTSGPGNVASSDRVQEEIYCWFSHDVTKIQTAKLSILLRFYFHGVLEQLKTNFHTNFRVKRVLGFVIEYA